MSETLKPREGHMWCQEGDDGDEAVGLFREHGCLKDGVPSDESAYRQGWRLVTVREVCRTCGGSGITDGWTPTYNDPCNEGGHPEAEPCDCEAGREKFPDMFNTDKTP